MKQFYLFILAVCGAIYSYAADVTVYYVNANSWASVYAYVWNDTKDLHPWPGKPMQKVADRQCSKGAVYSYTFSDEYSNIIFNNDDGMQTTDMLFDATRPYYSNGIWYAALSDIELDSDIPAERVYYLIGEFNNWNINTAKPFVKKGSNMTVKMDKLKGSFKILADRAWVVNFGAVTDSVPTISLGKTYAMESWGENLLLDEEEYADVTLQLTVKDDEHATLQFVSGSKTKAVHASTGYYVIGDFNEWNLETAIPFKKSGKSLTASIPELTGNFKVIKDHAWTVNFGAATEHIALTPGNAYQLTKDGKNMQLGADYKNVTLMLIEGDKMTLYFVSGVKQE